MRMRKHRKKPQKAIPQPDGFLSNLDDYPRQVILCYSAGEHREFKRLVGELAEKLGTGNQSDTILCAVRALMSVPQRFRVV